MYVPEGEKYIFSSMNKKRTLFFLRSMMVLVFLFSFLGTAGMAPLTRSQEALAITKIGDVQFFEGIGTGGAKQDPREIVKNIINVAMGFLGMLAVVVILYAGFKWLTAGGNKEQLESAHKMLINGVLGLVIIFSAWTIAQFVIYALKESVKE
jgi:amino acid transporter